MTDPENGPIGDAGASGTGVPQSDHARLRAQQGRPTGQVVNDIQRAGPSDVFVQTDDGRFVVRGPRGREHVLEANGEHVTSVRRSDAAHLSRLRDGNLRPATAAEFQQLKSLV